MTGVRVFVVCFTLFCACIFAPIGAFAGETIVLEIESAQAGLDERTKEPIVSYKFTGSSARNFADFTSRNVGKPTEVSVDGRVLMTPMIREPILGGSGKVSGSYTVEQTQDIVGHLKPGAKLEIRTLVD